MIILVRHGQTDANQKRYAGREDNPLNAAGKRQAHALINQLAAHNISRIFTSPLRRAVQTAQPLAMSLSIVPELRNELLELDFGCLQGLPKQRIQLSLRKLHLYQPIAKGESLYDVWLRVAWVAAEISEFQANDSEDVVIVGHYWTNRLLYGLLTGLDFVTAAQVKDFRPKTGEFKFVCNI